MIIQFLPQAKSELLDAVEYYEGESSGMGYRFWEEVSLGSRNTMRYLACGPAVYRRVNMKVFPYYISYIVRDPIIWILAVAHGHPGRTTDSYRFDVMGQTAL